MTAANVVGSKTKTKTTVLVDPWGRWPRVGLHSPPHFPQARWGSPLGSLKGSHWDPLKATRAAGSDPEGGRLLPLPKWDPMRINLWTKTSTKTSSLQGEGLSGGLDVDLSASQTGRKSSKLRMQITHKIE